MTSANKYSPEEWLRKYEAGELTPEERKIFESWYERLAPGGRSAVPDKGQRKATLDVMWQHMEQRIGGQPRPVRRISPLYWRAAAACLVVIAAIYLLMNRMHIWKQQQQLAMSHDQRISTAAREVKRLILPDSTVVWLNAASTVSFSDGMDDDSIRRVTLIEGEAFFDVKQDPSHPFEVVTKKGLTTRVLGTSFDIRWYNNDELAAVAVATGKVQVKYGNAFPTANCLLTAGQALRIGQDSTGWERYQLEPSTAAAWRSGKLSFDHNSLTEIGHILERWYNVPVRILKGDDQTGRYNARFNHGASLKDVLQLLSITENIHHQTVRDTIWISGK